MSRINNALSSLEIFRESGLTRLAYARLIKYNAKQNDSKQIPRTVPTIVLLIAAQTDDDFKSQ